MTLRILVLFAVLICPAAMAAELPGIGDLDADPALAGWWKFDEESGTSAADSSEHGRRGQLDGGLSFDKNSVPGRLGRALSFDGQDDAVRIVGYKGIAGTAPRSISVWIKTDTPVGDIVSWGKKDFGRMWKLCFIRKHAGVTPEGGYYYMAADIHNGEWRHVAAVVHKAELPNLYENVTLYLDGEIAEIDKIGLLDLWPIETGSDQDVVIGKGYKGSIDDLRIYERELTDEEVAALHEAGN